MATWKDIFKLSKETVQTAWDAVKNTSKTTAGAAKNVAIGSGAVGAAGGAAGNWASKGVVGTALSTLNKGFKLIRDNPRISSLFVTIAAATGIVAWWKTRKAKKIQYSEASELQASILANREQQAAISGQMGQDNPARADGKQWTGATTAPAAGFQQSTRP